jgi:hypothetical protein
VYTERVAEAGAVTSVGSHGDAYNNALAESFTGLYKAELFHRLPCRVLDDVKFGTLEYIDSFNDGRLHGGKPAAPMVEVMPCGAWGGKVWPWYMVRVRSH